MHLFLDLMQNKKQVKRFAFLKEVEGCKKELISTPSEAMLIYIRNGEEVGYIWRAKQGALELEYWLWED